MDGPLVGGQPGGMFNQLFGRGSFPHRFFAETELETTNHRGPKRTK